MQTATHKCISSKKKSGEKEAKKCRRNESQARYHQKAQNKSIIVNYRWTKHTKKTNFLRLIKHL